MVQDKQSYALVIRMLFVNFFLFCMDVRGVRSFLSVGPDPLAARAKPKFMGGSPVGSALPPQLL